MWGRRTFTHFPRLTACSVRSKPAIITMQALFPNCTQKSNHINVIFIAIVAGGFFGHIQPWEIHVSFARRRLNTWSPPQRLNTSPHAELPATARPPRHGRHGSNVLRSKQKLHWHEWSKDSKDSKAPNGSAKSWALICFWSASVWVFSMPWALHLSQVSQAWLEQVDLTALGVMPFHPFLNQIEGKGSTALSRLHPIAWGEFGTCVP